jgi:hypothetical protein
MLRCESCHGRTEQLAQTATGRWIACPTCHRVWSLDFGSRTVLPVGVATVASEFSQTQVSALRGCLISLLAVALAFAVRWFCVLLSATRVPFCYSHQLKVATSQSS